MVTVSGHVAALKHLLKAGASVNASTVHGQTLLHVAVLASNIEMVEALLDAGADINAVTRDGFTPLMLVVLTGGSDKALQHINTISEEACQGILGILIQKSANLYYVASKGCSALHYAVYTNNIPAVEALVAAHVDIDAYDKGGYTPMHMAAALGRETAAECLLRAGANIAVQTKNPALPWSSGFFETPGHGAGMPHYFGHWENDLVNEDARKCRIDCIYHDTVSDKWQPLHLATVMDDLGMVNLLLQHGANVHALERCRSSPLNLAVHLKSSSSMVELLQEYEAKTRVKP